MSADKETRLAAMYGTHRKFIEVEYVDADGNITATAGRIGGDNLVTQKYKVVWNNFGDEFATLAPQSKIFCIHFPDPESEHRRTFVFVCEPPVGDS